MGYGGSMKKIRNLEFLRVIGCIAIVLLHLYNLKFLGGLQDVRFYHHMREMTHNGQKAVDLFFILSGMFFVITYKPMLSVGKFILKKIIRLYPVLIFGLVTYFIMACFGISDFDLYNDILTFFGLNGTTLIQKTVHMGCFWYVSAMLWMLLLLFYLSKNYEKKNIKLFAGLAAFFAYCFMVTLHNGKLTTYRDLYGFINTGMLRAIAGVCTGYLVGDWYVSHIDKIKNLVVNIKTKIVITLLEFLCLFFIINNLMLHEYRYPNDILFVLAFIGVIVLFLMEKGFISKCLDKDIFVQLSKYTYSIYMTHQIVFKILSPVFWTHNMKFVTHHPVMNFSLTMFIVLAVGVLVYHLVEYPCARYLKKKFIKD